MTHFVKMLWSMEQRINQVSRIFDKLQGKINCNCGIIEKSKRGVKAVGQNLRYTFLGMITLSR